MKDWLIRNQIYIYLGLALFLSVIGTLQSIQIGEKFYGPEGPYTHYNNYVIFASSYDHLLEGSNLYSWYLDEHWDLYKYTPTFSLFFGIFSVLPDWLGLFLWNALNGLILFIALWKIDFRKNAHRWLALGFVLLEFILALQNSQSNSLIAGLIILSFLSFEKEKWFWGVAFLMFASFIKPFALVGFAMCLFYPNKLKLAAYAMLTAVVLFLLPAFVTGFDELFWQYKNWFEMLGQDHDQSIGISVMGIISSWFSAEPSKLAVLLSGVVLFCIPLVRFKSYQSKDFRTLMLASILIWIVIFNHKAESPTFIIACAGMVIWYFYSERNALTLTLILLAFVLTCLSPSDLFPPGIREDYIWPYKLKVLPSVLIWGVLTLQLLSRNFIDQSPSDS